MNTEDRKLIAAQITAAHSLVEKAYVKDLSVPGSEEWLNKRRLLLADLALHLTEACVKEEFELHKIQRYLFSVLNIAHDFAPEAGLKETAERILSSTAS